MSFTYYSSLSGMLAASFGLQNTSHNVANMQSPGFKRNEVFYSSLGDGRRQNCLGFGVQVGGICTNFSAGKYVETGEPSDVAIVGNGFFIVRQKNGELLYTRDGEFRFNKEGLLEDRHSGGLVQGYDKNRNLVPIQQSGPATLVGKKSSLIDLSGDIVLHEKTNKDPLDPEKRKSDYENLQFSLSTIYDEKGKPHTLKVELKPLGPFNDTQKGDDGLELELFKVSYDDLELDLDFSFQTLKFSRNDGGAAEEGYNTLKIKLSDNQTVSLRFGNLFTDQDKSVRLNKADPTKNFSPIKIYTQDGYEEGKQIAYSFDENGQISYKYDNNKSVEGVHLALAKFENLEQSLIQTSDNLFRAKFEHGRQIGRANKGGFGTIQSKKLETSNVDSTMEFANIVVLQRMFQACSQIMDIDKQLLEELFKK